MTGLTGLDCHCDPAQDEVTNSSVFDPAGLVERCMGQTSTACLLLGLFRDRLPGTIADICDRLLTLNDVTAALTTLHTLKGNAGNLCAGRLFQAAIRLEQTLRNEQFADTAMQLSDLRQEADRFLRALPSDLETLMNNP